MIPSLPTRPGGPISDHAVWTGPAVHPMFKLPYIACAQSSMLDPPLPEGIGGPLEEDLVG